MTPLEFSREHAAITRMFVTLTRSVCRKYFPGETQHHQIELVGLLFYVILGHIDRKPQTVSKLSRAFGISRATTRRWLRELIESGYIERVGNVYWVTKNETTSASVRNVLAKNVELILATARELGGHFGHVGLLAAARELVAILAT
jgi:transposase-like protein